MRRSPAQVLRRYLLLRLQRQSPPSLAGIEWDIPRGTAPSDEYDELACLCRGVSSLVCDVLSVRYFARAGTTWDVVTVPLRYDTMGEWEAADPATRGGLLTEERQVAVMPSWSQVARAFGYTPTKIQRMARGAEDAVGAALAERT